MFGSFYKMALGSWALTVVQDRHAQGDPANLAANASAEELDALLAANGLNRSVYMSTVNVMFIETADRKILIDTGIGGDAGRLLPTLRLLEVDPASITDILISHSHMDHVGGLSDDTTGVYPNATVMIGQTEFDAQAASLSRLTPYTHADRLRVMPDSGEWLPGITAIPAFGHTPGHTAFLLENEGTSLLMVMDAANNNVISLARPDWAFRFDADPAMASASRRALLEKAVVEQRRVFGYHFAFPGVGFVARDRDSYRWVVLTP
ncbi:MAG: MBL fold metallo-hydrolase [Chloroflexi bacterium]|nr:MBL fold metallo-hydrolase [Chloroflexota bacterium]